MTNGMKIGRNIGAAIGVVAFLAFGIMPGFYFGSYGTLVILSHLMGGPMDANILVRMLVVAGTLFGLFCVGTVSVVIGSVFGTAVGYVTEILTTPAKAREEAEAKAKIS